VVLFFNATISFLGKRETRIELLCKFTANETTKNNEFDDEEERTEIIDANEPSTCKYEIKLGTKLVCKNDAYNGEELLDVNLYMEKSLLSQLNSIKDEFLKGIITEKVKTKETITYITLYRIAICNIKYYKNVFNPFH
jgi:hypothetical protein